MSLDISKLENVRKRGEKVKARCPACSQAGHDQRGEHLVVGVDGRFACVVYPGDSVDAKEHRKRIFALCGDREIKPLAVRPSGLGRLGRVIKSRSAGSALKTSLLGRLGRVFQSHLEPSNGHKQAVFPVSSLKDYENGVLGVPKPNRPLRDRERDLLREKGMENDPLIIEALNIFDGRIVE
jgi:hypothetical protein